MSLADTLRTLVRGEVENAPAILEQYSRDASLFRVLPEVVVRPQDAEDVATLVRFVTKEKQKDTKSSISLTARSAGTDMSGGPLNNSIILDMTRHFNKIIEVGNDMAVVEPGVYFRDFDKETKKDTLGGSQLSRGDYSGRMQNWDYARPHSQKRESRRYFSKRDIDV